METLSHCSENVALISREDYGVGAGVGTLF